jgi:hypothetical protein
MEGAPVQPSDLVALAAAPNFISILAPIAMFAVLVMVGVGAGPEIAPGLTPTAGGSPWSR